METSNIKALGSVNIVSKKLKNQQAHIRF